MLECLLSLLIPARDSSSSSASKASSLLTERSFSSDPDIDIDNAGDADADAAVCPTADITRGGDPPLLELLGVSAACQKKKEKEEDSGIKQFMLV